jgi:hypothetical protein
MAQSEVLLEVHADCEKTASLVAEKLSAAGFRVMHTFDIQFSNCDHPGCRCPHHGTDKCDCQMAILLVYGASAEPVSLVFHGRDHRTQIEWIVQPGQRVRADEELKIWKAVARPILSAEISEEAISD